MGFGIFISTSNLLEVNLPRPASRKIFAEKKL